ncbi:hypothetical protein Poly41_67140 [Novipirellula artificiosorum]|uniref:Uncharacterized protein n=1 Tax=Novipirellula artificiosorum TaxID=2528016 RepID=A0A5C6CX43_9BACT|nr:hypothetical protein Poly41_67140 [Novipirellula artificiosorum]
MAGWPLFVYINPNCRSNEPAERRIHPNQTCFRQYETFAFRVFGQSLDHQCVFSLCLEVPSLIIHIDERSRACQCIVLFNHPGNN